MSIFRLVRGGERLTWQRHMTGDIRVEQVSCDASWFYKQMLSSIPTEARSAQPDLEGTR